MNKRRRNRQYIRENLPTVLDRVIAEIPVPQGEWERILDGIHREENGKPEPGRIELHWPETPPPLVFRLAAGAAMLASVAFLSLISLFPESGGAAFIPGRDLTVGRIVETVTPALDKIEESINSCLRQENQ